MGASLGAALTPPSPAPAQQPEAGVEELAPGVYLFTYEAHRSLFVVTPRGVVATDPQSPERAAAYLEAIRGVTDRPVRYILYSHHHADHVSGAEVLRRGREGRVPIIAHARARAAIEAGRAGAVVPPDIVFDREFALHLDGITVRGLYLGRSETDNNIAVLVPERGVLFSVDNVTVRALPWREMADGYPLEWIETLRRMEELDFEILAPGHGPVGSREDVVALRRYLEELRDAVAAELEAGATLEQIQERVSLPAYAHWQRYEEHLPLNVAGMYRALTGAR